MFLTICSPAHVRFPNKEKKTGYNVVNYITHQAVHDLDFDQPWGRN